MQLLGRYPWQWYCTLTFKVEKHPEAADKAFRYAINKLNKKIFGNNYARSKKLAVQWVRALEWQKRDVIHFHVLVTNVGTTSRDELKKLWEEFGFSKIDVYFDDGAIEYVLKDIVKDGELDVSLYIERTEQLKTV